jgi:hypothetical protein
MSGVNEWVTREYFEALGFWVSQPCKYASTRHKTLEEEIDLLVSNPRAEPGGLPAGMLWTRADLRRVSRAVVRIYGWHTDRFYSEELDLPETLRFAGPECMRAAARRANASDLARVLVLSQLPASGKLKDKALATLRDKGVDGVLLFPTMLMELADTVDVRRNYDKSDLLQIIRLFKIYGLLKDNQLDLFPRRRRRATAAPAEDAEPAVEG